jgi:hypothetical protein
MAILFQSCPVLEIFLQAIYDLSKDIKNKKEFKTNMKT